MPAPDDTWQTGLRIRGTGRPHPRPAATRPGHEGKVLRCDDLDLDYHAPGRRRASGTWDLSAREFSLLGT